MIYWTGFGESRMKNGWQHVHKPWGRMELKMKARNEDDQLGQVGMPNLDNILSGCGLANGA
jgi:hypothetical protein